MNYNKLTKEEWEKLYSRLEKLYAEFEFAYNHVKLVKGNSKVKECEKRMNTNIDLAKIWIEKYEESYLIYNGENATPFERQDKWTETSRPNYFKIDMYEFLEKIKSKF